MNADYYEKHRIEFAAPLLVIKVHGRILGCGYFNTETFNKTGEVFAMVSGVSDFDEMLTASVVSTSDAAAKIGIVVGDTGEEALEKMLDAGEGK